MRCWEHPRVNLRSVQKKVIFSRLFKFKLRIPSKNRYEKTVSEFLGNDSTVTFFFQNLFSGRSSQAGNHLCISHEKFSLRCQPQWLQQQASRISCPKWHLSLCTACWTQISINAYPLAYSMASFLSGPSSVIKLRGFSNWIQGKDYHPYCYQSHALFLFVVVILRFFFSSNFSINPPPRCK